MKKLSIFVLFLLTLALVSCKGEPIKLPRGATVEVVASDDFAFEDERIAGLIIEDLGGEQLAYDVAAELRPLETMLELSGQVVTLLVESRKLTKFYSVRLGEARERRLNQNRSRQRNPALQRRARGGSELLHSRRNRRKAGRQGRHRLRHLGQPGQNPARARASGSASSCGRVRASRSRRAMRTTTSSPRKSPFPRKITAEA